MPEDADTIVYQLQRIASCLEHITYFQRTQLEMMQHAMHPQVRMDDSIVATANPVAQPGWVSGKWPRRGQDLNPLNRQK